MEAAPLTLAHTHARNASLETQRSNPVAASEEHDLAATEFATAAQGSTDQEVVRILNLLEQHHKQLGQILRTAHEKPHVDETSTTPEASKTVESLAKPPRLPRTSKENTRDLSSSIASNLATARGIPSTRQKRSTPISPLVSNQHADGHMSKDANKSGQPQSSSSRPSWAPPLRQTEDVPAPSEASDSPFQQFYNTFEGLINKMSAPLAFAGLPLAQPTPEKDPEPPKSTAKTPRSSKKDVKPLDYSQLISSAAFRAVSANATSPSPGKKLEDSFFYVPGTMSYAEMVNRADREEARTLRHHRHLSNISEDDFVDAPTTPSANQQQKPLRRGMTAERKVDGKTMEELALENQALKHISDTLSRRLHVFEMSSQTSTAALAQSIRSMPRSPLMTPEHSRKKQLGYQQDSEGGSDNTSKRIAELEDILKKSDAKSRKREAENEKLRMTVERYRDKWDSLKAGAKARREKQQQGGSGASRRDSESIPEESEV